MYALGEMSQSTVKPRKTTNQAELKKKQKYSETLTEDTLTLHFRDQGSQQAQEKKAKRYDEHLLRRFRLNLAKQHTNIPVSS